VFNPPKVPGKDDATGESLVQRRDDREETVRQRIATYYEQSKPLIDYYSQWHRSGEPGAPRYVRINGSGAVEQVRDQLFAALAEKR
jgi:adenylate kinase